MRPILRMTASFCKQTVRRRDYSFWMIFFPILLTVFMYLPFSNLETAIERPVAVGIDAQNEVVPILEHIDRLDLYFYGETAGREALAADTIDAYVLSDLNLMVKENGYRQKIVRNILNHIGMMRDMTPEQMARLRPEADYAERRETPTDEFQIYFYNIIALFSLYSYFGAFESTAFFQANQSALGQRNAVSPVPKYKGILAAVFSTLLTSALSMMLLLILTEYVLKLNLITNLPASILSILGGVLFGIGLGLLVGAVRLPEWARSLIGIAGTLFLSMLSGLMGIDMRNLITKHAPIIHRLNPASLVTESFFNVNVLGNDRFLLPNFLTLLGYAAILATVASILLSRRSYKSL